MTPIWRTLLTGLLATLMSATAVAEPGFARHWKNQFGYMPSCNACHKDGGGTPVNDYGQQYKDAGSTAAAFAQIAALDADGDGVSNGDEAAAKSNPADADSTPGAAGDWLDINNLIPRTVQAAFADATAYKPIDAIYTQREIDRAAGMGVTLSEADETTIYVAINGSRPIGTAIIVPGVHEGQQYFVQLVTDRQLVVTEAAPLRQNAEVFQDTTLYAGAIGQNIANLPGPESDDLVGNVQRTVQKAGVMLLVRLKPE